MSIETGTGGPPAALDRIGGPPTLIFPEGWTTSKSWHRAQAAPSDVSPGQHPAEWHVLMGAIDDPHDPLTTAERDAYENTVKGEYGVREYARATDRSCGTVGNLLSRAREKLHARDLSHHRVTFAIEDGDVVAECPCDGYTYRGFCAHVAVLWWRWSRGRLVVRDLVDDQNHQHPPDFLEVDDREVTQ